MSDLVTAVGQHPAALAVASVSGVLLLQLAVGKACDHEVELRALLARVGRWLAEAAVWATEAVPAVGRAVSAGVRAALVWLLKHLLRAHGHHRAGVAS